MNKFKSFLSFVFDYPERPIWPSILFFVVIFLIAFLAFLSPINAPKNLHNQQNQTVQTISASSLTDTPTLYHYYFSDTQNNVDYVIFTFDHKNITAHPRIKY